MHSQKVARKYLAFKSASNWRETLEDSFYKIDWLTDLSLVFLVSGVSYETTFASVLYDFALREENKQTKQN